LNAFRLNSIDYILKPITKEQIATSFDKYFQMKDSLQTKRYDYQDLIQVLKPQRYKERFMVKYQNKIVSLSTSEVACFFAEDGINCLLTFNQEKFVIDYTLDDLETMLNPVEFFRANRKYILSIQSITEVHPYFKGRLKVFTSLHLPNDLIISNQRANKFKEWLGK
jgi:DNA-binding LytR/AlgR family response regulator